MINRHRKGHKTTLSVKNLVQWAATTPWVFWYISPSYGLAKKTIWDEPEMLPQILPSWYTPNKFYKKNETELKITFPKYGGQLHILGADRPDLMRGPNPRGIILDEYSVQRKEVWELVIQPIVLANPKAWAWFIFTPRGKNHAYDMMLKHQNHPEWQIMTQNIYYTKVFSQNQIDQMKEEMSEQSFKQEMLCEFLEGEGSVFRHVKEVMYKPTLADMEVKKDSIYVMGVDLAKSTDYTVITVYDRRTNKQVYQDRFQVLEWPFQKAKIAMTSRRFNNALVVMDATGLGNPIYDDLIRMGVPVEPFKFTNISKKELIEKLSIYIEQKYIRMFDDENTSLEFDSYEIDYTPSGMLTYNARSGMHDDIVIAHALAVSQLHPVSKFEMLKEPTRLQAYYQQLQEPKDPEYGLAEWADPDY